MLAVSTSRIASRTLTPSLFRSSASVQPDIQDGNVEPRACAARPRRVRQALAGDNLGDARPAHGPAENARPTTRRPRRPSRALVGGLTLVRPLLGLDWTAGRSAARAGRPGNGCLPWCPSRARTPFDEALGAAHPAPHPQDMPNPRPPPRGPAARGSNRRGLLVLGHADPGVLDRDRMKGSLGRRSSSQVRTRSCPGSRIALTALVIRFSTASSRPVQGRWADPAPGPLSARCAGESGRSRSRF